MRTNNAADKPCLFQMPSREVLVAVNEMPSSRIYVLIQRLSPQAVDAFRDACLERALLMSRDNPAGSWAVADTAAGAAASAASYTVQPHDEELEVAARERERAWQLERLAELLGIAGPSVPAASTLPATPDLAELCERAQYADNPPVMSVDDKEPPR